MEKPQVVAVTQARVGSSRFPSKILKEIKGVSLLGHHLNRLQKAQSLSQVVVATTYEPGAGDIMTIAAESGAACFQGSTDDVLDRFYQSIVSLGQHSPDYIVRVTSDCPLLDPTLVDQVVEYAVSNTADYVSNVLVEAFPDGQDIEVMTFAALEQAWKNARLDSEREHVTPYIRNRSDFNGGDTFKALNFKAPGNYNHLRMTVDEPADLEAIVSLIEHVGTDAGWLEYARFIMSNTDMFSNQEILRNEGYLKSTQKEKK